MAAAAAFLCLWGAADAGAAAVDRSGLRSRVLAGAPLDAAEAKQLIGKTKAGAPKHPLYIKSGTQLEAFRP